MKNFSMIVGGKSKKSSKNDLIIWNIIFECNLFILEHDGQKFRNREAPNSDEEGHFF
jgi:hypothetical protein